jgi:hypothetical protein
LLPCPYSPQNLTRTPVSFIQANLGSALHFLNQLAQIQSQAEIESVTLSSTLNVKKRCYTVSNENSDVMSVKRARIEPSSSESDETTTTGETSSVESITDQATTDDVYQPSEEGTETDTKSPTQVSPSLPSPVLSTVVDQL